MSQETIPPEPLDLDRHVHGAPASEKAGEPKPALAKAPSRVRPVAIRLSVLVLAGSVAAVAILHAPTRARLLNAINPEPAHSEAVAESPAPRPSRSLADGLIELDAEQVRALGVEVAEVRPLSEPTRLEINGTTAYDPNNQIQVRPRFTSVIDRVYVGLGQEVKPGDPLVDLFSAELAAAKSQYEKTQAQWERDKRELERGRKLFQESPPAISQKEYYLLSDDERVTRAEAKIAADTLMVYGITEEELARIPSEDGSVKAKMTLRAPSGGVVIRKDVVRGNRYDATDVLLVIAPLDHFWVWGHVYPADATRVAIGQRWRVRCLNAECEAACTIESISSEIDPQTRTVLIRTHIDNPDGRLKSEMLVGGYVEIPPNPGQTVIPRDAMVSADGADYVFVEHPTPGAPSRFERRPIHSIQEHHDRVIVADGLIPGERIASRGSLILAQIAEESLIVGH